MQVMSEEEASTQAHSSGEGEGFLGVLDVVLLLGFLTVTHSFPYLTPSPAVKGRMMQLPVNSWLYDIIQISLNSK